MIQCFKIMTYRREIMKLKNIPKEELELYSYIDLTKMILKEEGKSLNTPTIFGKICK